jgi:orotate phosphoribosyltransferase
MIYHNYTAKKTAELLLQINAIKLNSKNHFTWASGWNSPIYCDNRMILSFPEIRNYVKEELAKIVLEKYGKPDLIAGVATGAIGIGMLVADALQLPFIYVRPEPKKHGRQNQVEGFAEKGQKVVVIEDLISTGKSSLQAVDALRESELNVIGMVAIFSYGFAVATQNFEAAQLPLVTLSNYDSLIEQAMETNYIDKNELQTLQDWRVQPEIWKK